MPTQQEWDQATPLAAQNEWDQATPLSRPAADFDPTQAKKGTDALIYSQLLGISPSDAYQNHQTITEQLETRLGESARAGWQGLSKQSIIGEFINKDIPEPFDDGSEVNRWINELGQMAGDIPFYLVGQQLGKVAGTAIGGLGSSETGPGALGGAAIGGAVGGQAGGFALTAGLRQLLIDKYQNGQVDSFEEIMDILKASGKGALVGAATGAAGKFAPVATGVVGKIGTPYFYKGAAELAAMTTVGDLLEGKVPTKQDFIDNAAMLVAMHVGMSGLDFAKRSVFGISAKSMDMYAKDGVTPQDVVSRGAQRAQETAPADNPAEIVSRIDNEIAAISGEKADTEQAAPKEEPQEKLVPAIRTGDGDVIEGIEGSTHDEVLAGEGLSEDTGERGFVDPEGNFLTRKEAEAWTAKNEPEVHRALVASDDGLHSENYNQAKESTGIKNAVTEQERAARGLPEVEVEARRSLGGAFEAGKKAVDSGQIDPRQLAEDMAMHPRALNAEESAALIYDRMRLQNEHAEIMTGIEDARAKGDTEREARERERLSSVEEAINTNDEAARRTGYEQGLGLAARRMMAKQDYSLANTLQRARVASKDGVIAPEVRDRLEDLTRQLEEANKRIDGYEEAKKQAAAERTVERIKRTVARGEKKADLKSEYDSLLKDLNKELMHQYANPVLNPKLYELFGRLAVNRIQSGVVTIEGIVDDLHTALQEHGLSKREIRDYISQYGRTKELSKDQVKVQLREARAQGRLISALEDVQESGDRPAKSGLQREPPSDKVRKLREQLDQAMKDAGMKVRPKASPESKLKAYKARVENQIREMEERLRTGDYSKPERRTTILDQEAEALKAKAEKIKGRLDDAIQRQKDANRSPVEKGAAIFQKWRRAVLLSSVTTLGKLETAAMLRFGTTPIEEMIGGVLSKMPVIRDIAAKAPREGGGFNLSAEAKAFSQFFQKATYEDIKEAIKTGKTSLDYLYGKKSSLPPEALDFFGHLHGALKVLPKRAEFFRSMEIRAQWALDNHLDIQDPKVQATIAAEAYIDANRAIFMQENFINTGFRMMMNYFHSQGLSGRSTEFMIQTVLPIVKVPTNIVFETSDYAVGAAKGSLEALSLVIRKNGMKNLTMQQADNIMRSLKKGSVGLAVLAIGYYAGQTGGQFIQAGGFYQPGDEKKPIKPNSLVIGGVEVPPFLQHTPVGMTFEMGATIRRVNDAYTMQGHSGGFVAGATASGLGVAKSTPFLEEATRLGEATRTADSAGLFVDDVIQSMIVPPDLRRVAQMTDDGAVRKPTNLVESIEAGIPGLRENVPAKGGKKARFSIRK